MCTSQTHPQPAAPGIFHCGITLFNLAPQKLHSKIKMVSEDIFRAEVVEEKGEKEKIQAREYVQSHRQHFFFVSVVHVENMCMCF